MKKVIPMAVASVCIATAAFASMKQPANTVTVNRDKAVVADTIIPQTNQDNNALFPTTESADTTQPTQTDTTQPTQTDTTQPTQDNAWPSSDTSTTTDTSGVK